MFGLKRPAAVSAAAAKDVPNNWTAVEQALDGIGEGRFDSVSLQDVPAALQPALLRLLEKMRANSGRQLQRAVTLSVHANEAMVANAKTSGELSRAVELAQGIAGAVENLDQSIESIALTARSISNAVQTSGAVLLEGADAVREAVSASERVHVSFEAIGAAASGLTESVKQIGTFVATIEGIAQQTNLLALNATIEAARAGAAGRGFSVVAAEVKALSAQTQRATEDIRSRIDHLTANVTEVLASVDLVRSDVDITARCARSADERIAAVRADGEGNIAAVSGITAAIGEQGAAVERISKNVGALNHRFEEARKQYARIVAEIAHCETAIKAQFTALEKRDIPASTLHRAKSDYAMWRRILTEVVFSGRKVTSRDMADHTQSRLGLWMADHGHANPASAALDAPHRAVHTHGKEAAACMLRGDLPGAIAALERTDAASETMMAALDRAIAAADANLGVDGASQRDAA